MTKQSSTDSDVESSSNTDATQLGCWKLFSMTPTRSRLVTDRSTSAAYRQHVDGANKQRFVNSTATKEHSARYAIKAWNQN